LPAQEVGAHIERDLIALADVAGRSPRFVPPAPRLPAPHPRPMPLEMAAPVSNESASGRLCVNRHFHVLRVSVVAVALQRQNAAEIPHGGW
jgi:hypothetical protein